MTYPSLLDLADEDAYRRHFEFVYCRAVIRTFDGIEVRFHKGDFDHCCFESQQRNNVKDTFSRRRAERLDWIKTALEDPASELYQGWDKRRKRYDLHRRVALVMGNYVVVIAMKGADRADFVTAYVADTPAGVGRRSTVDLIRTGPPWKKQNR